MLWTETKTAATEKVVSNLATFDVRRAAAAFKATMTAVLVGLAATAPMIPSTAMACGGCFSPPGVQSNQAILQDAERVFFHYDPGTKKTLVWVEVKYSGLAKDFGWVLPLPSKPKVAVGTSWVFDRFDQRQAPRFATSVEPQDENCQSWYTYCYGNEPSSAQNGPGSGSSGGGFASDAGSSAGASEDGDKGPVQVLEQDKAGPYDYEIIAASEAKPLQQWLKKNGYKMPDKALPILEAHIKKGDVFVAFKLQNGAGANEVRPVVLEMEDADPCVPLRLTSIAASEDMSVVVTLAGEGRAIPKNHMQVEPNLARLNWFANANNYGQLLSAAIDEAEGRAFVTEFSGPTKNQGPLAGAPKMVIDPVYNVSDAESLGRALIDSKMPMIQDLANTIERATGLAKAASVEPLQYYTQLRSCAQQKYNNQYVGYCKTFMGERATMPVDGKKLGDMVKKDFMDPLAAVQAAMDGSKTVTRMVMRISPEEMDRDPLFAFNKDLPAVSNQKTARFKRVCSTGWYPYDSVRFTLDGYGSWVIKGQLPGEIQGGPVGNNAIDPRFAKAAAAAAILVQDEKGNPVEVGKDETELVDTAIKGSIPGKPTLPAGMTLKSGGKRWTPPENDPTVKFIEQRDDSKCTVWHVVKAWETGSEKAAKAVMPGADNDADEPVGGCSSGGSSGDAALLFAELFAMLAVVRRKRVTAA